LRLRILSYATWYYIGRVAKLERILAKEPRVLQRQFGLVDNERVDEFLAAAFANQEHRDGDERSGPNSNGPLGDTLSARPNRTDQ
jgi:hypothetical protein